MKFRARARPRSRGWSCSLVLESNVERGVIGGFGAAALGFVDAGFDAALGDGTVQKDVVDAKAAIPAEGPRAIVPPRVESALGVELAQRIVQAEVEQVRERPVLIGMKVKLPAHLLYVEDIAIFARDVEVAAQ